jgi:hypothetical protein
VLGQANTQIVMQGDGDGLASFLLRVDHQPLVPLGVVLDIAPLHGANIASALARFDQQRKGEREMRRRGRTALLSRRERIALDEPPLHSDRPCEARRGSVGPRSAMHRIRALAELALPAQALVGEFPQDADDHGGQVASGPAVLLLDLVAMMSHMLAIEAGKRGARDVGVEQVLDHRPISRLRARPAALSEVVVREELLANPPERPDRERHTNRAAISARRQRCAPLGYRIREPREEPRRGS